MQKNLAIEYILALYHIKKYGYRENGRKLYVWDSQGFYTTYNFIGMWKFLILEKFQKKKSFNFPRTINFIRWSNILKVKIFALWLCWFDIKYDHLAWIFVSNFVLVTRFEIKSFSFNVFITAAVKLITKKRYIKNISRLIYIQLI